jgi:hypothetical protein
MKKTYKKIRKSMKRLNGFLKNTMKLLFITFRIYRLIQFLKTVEDNNGIILFLLEFYESIKQIMLS